MERSSWGNSENIKVLPEGQNLGTIIKVDGYMDSEVTNRITQAQTAMHHLNTWRSRELETNCKPQVFNTLVRTVLTYALEAHVLTYTQLGRVTRTPARIDKEHNVNLPTRKNIHSVTVIWNLIAAKGIAFPQRQHRRYNFIVWTVGIGQPTNAHPIYVRATERFGS